MAGQNIGKGTDSTKITFLLEENEAFGNVLAKQEKINQISELPKLKIKDFLLKKIQDG